MNCTVAGIDYSNAQIQIAKKAMPEMDFQTQEAKDLSTDKKFDYVLSMSVFEYFPNDDYTNIVLEKMIDKAKVAVAILDSNNIELFNLAKEIRRGALSVNEYAKKYKGLEHNFFSKQYFENFAREHLLDIEVFDQQIDNYLNANFRFNIILRK